MDRLPKPHKSILSFSQAMLHAEVVPVARAVVVVWGKEGNNG